MIFSIKDLENLSGIKAHTLRIWEQRYNILTPKRTESNIRYYDDCDLKLILNIALLNEQGIKISKIAEMTVEEIQQEVIARTEKCCSYAEQIQALTLCMMDLDEQRFEKVFAANILHLGFEETIINVIFPLMQKIGYLWQADVINPAHEHFISNLIRQKLIVAIDGQVVRHRPDAKKFMLFLPEGELHELSLLFCCYLIRSFQHQAVYLGQTLPFDYLQQAYPIHKPDYLLSSITFGSESEDVAAYVNKLATEFSDSTILLSGSQVLALQAIQIPSNVRVIQKIEDFICLLNELK